MSLSTLIAFSYLIPDCTNGLFSRTSSTNFCMHFLSSSILVSCPDYRCLLEITAQRVLAFSIFLCKPAQYWYLGLCSSSRRVWDNVHIHTKNLKSPVFCLRYRIETECIKNRDCTHNFTIRRITLSQNFGFKMIRLQVRTGLADYMLLCVCATNGRQPNFLYLALFFQFKSSKPPASGADLPYNRRVLTIFMRHDKLHNVLWFTGYTPRRVLR